MRDKEKARQLNNSKISMPGKMEITLLITLLMFIAQVSLKAQTISVASDSTSQVTTSKKNRQMKFVKAILSNSRDIWYKLFNDQIHKYYDEPKLVFYTSKVESTCGYKIATGPFYCPTDRTIYVDLSFYDDLNNRFVNSADFAMIYTVAHLIGHHVQNLLGNSDMLGEQENETSEIDINNIAIAFELQADFYAGVWARNNQKVKNLIVTGNFEEAMYAASAIGSDRMQKLSQGYVLPDNFNNGTSSQRFFWFNKGFETGDILQGDTFKDPNR